MAQHDLIDLHVDGDSQPREHQRPGFPHQPGHRGPARLGPGKAQPGASREDLQARRGEGRLNHEDARKCRQGRIEPDQHQPQQRAHGQRPRLRPDGIFCLQVGLQPQVGHQQRRLKKHQAQHGEQSRFLPAFGQAAGDQPEQNAVARQRDRETQDRPARQQFTRGVPGLQQIAFDHGIESERCRAPGKCDQRGAIAQQAKALRPQIPRNQEAHHRPKEKPHPPLGEKPAGIGRRLLKTRLCQNIGQLLHCRDDEFRRHPGQGRHHRLGGRVPHGDDLGPARLCLADPEQRRDGHASGNA